MLGAERLPVTVLILEMKKRRPRKLNDLPTAAHLESSKAEILAQALWQQIYSLN